MLACCMFKWGDETAAGAGTIQKVQVLEELLQYANKTLDMMFIKADRFSCDYCEGIEALLQLS